MARAYPRETIDKVIRLFEEGISYREIAKLTGVSRWTIQKIKNRWKAGRYSNEIADNQELLKSHAEKLASLAKSMYKDGVPRLQIATNLNVSLAFVDRCLNRQESHIQQIRFAYSRCPGCGGMVVKPCMLCSLGKRKGGSDGQASH